MKKGKFIQMGYHQNVKIGYGTIDYRNLKTIYVTFNSWVMPELTIDYDKLISKVRNDIRHKLYHTNNELFKKESIVDLDIRTNGVQVDKKSFMNLEITLYAEKQFDIKNPTIKNHIKNLCVDIIDNNLNDKKLFNFYRNKK